jgi:serine/threonine protein kinase
VDALAEHLEACGPCAAAVAVLDDTPDPLVAQLRRSLPASTSDAVDSTRVVALIEPLGQDAQPTASEEERDLREGAAEPARLGQYILLEKLGEGGMEQVYKARHELMNRVVALKIIHPKRLENVPAVQRFQRENP